MIWSFQSLPITNTSGSSLLFVGVGGLANFAASVFTGNCATILNLQTFPPVFYTPLQNRNFIAPSFGVVFAATRALLSMQVFNPADGTSERFDLAAGGTLELKRAAGIGKRGGKLARRRQKKR
jgi:hypothetical protein